MKFFLALTLVTISNLVCASNEFTPTCQKEFDNICGKMVAEKKSECMQNAISNLSNECRTSLEAKKSANQKAPGPCDNDLKTVCKDKADDQIAACLSKSGSSACKESVKKMTINVCPAAPDECKLDDYAKDADKAEDCFANYFDGLSPECKKLSGIR